MRLFLLFLLFCASLLLSSALVRNARVELLGVTCKNGGEQPFACVLPYRARADDPNFRATVTLHRAPLSPRRYVLVALGCLRDLRVNGYPVPLPKNPCGAPLLHAFDFSPFLIQGKNKISFHIENASQPFIIHEFTLQPSRMDPLILGLTLTLIVFAGLAGILVFGFPRRVEQGSALLFLFLGGALLRFLSMSATSYSLRAYDWQHHLFYIHYLLTHGSLPPAGLGWETYQPPLYYLFAAFLSKGLMLSQITPEFSPVPLQAFSLILSLLALGLGIAIGRVLFTKKEERRERLFFVLLLASFPGLIAFSSRISNDALVHVLLFLSFLFLLRWWKSKNMRDWLILSAVTALALLTKSNALLLLPVLYGSLLLKEKIPAKKKRNLLGLSLACTLILSGWFYVLRFGVEGEQSLIGNVDRHSPEILMEDARRPAQFFTFNPVRVLSHPFNNQWDDASGRKNFFEYFIRSLYFGHSSFDDRFIGQAVSLLFLTMLLLPVMLYGFWRSRDHLFFAPLSLTTAILLLGHMAYRFYLPQATTQDFRFSVLLIVPFGFFLVKGMEALPKWLQMPVRIAFFGLIGISVVFILMIYGYS